MRHLLGPHSLKDWLTSDTPWLQMKHQFACPIIDIPDLFVMDVIEPVDQVLFRPDQRRISAITVDVNTLFRHTA